MPHLKSILGALLALLALVGSVVMIVDASALFYGAHERIKVEALGGTRK